RRGRAGGQAGVEIGGEPIDLAVVLGAEPGAFGLGARAWRPGRVLRRHDAVPRRDLRVEHGRERWSESRTSRGARGGQTARRPSAKEKIGYGPKWSAVPNRGNR